MFAYSAPNIETVSRDEIESGSDEIESGSGLRLRFFISSQFRPYELPGIANRRQNPILIFTYFINLNPCRLGELANKSHSGLLGVSRPSSH
jgi:hypothetical protein